MKIPLPKPHPDDRDVYQKLYDANTTIEILRGEVLKDKKYIEESKKVIKDYLKSFKDGNVNASRFNSLFTQVLAEHNKL